MCLPRAESEIGLLAGPSMGLRSPRPLQFRETVWWGCRDLITGKQCAGFLIALAQNGFNKDVTR